MTLREMYPGMINSVETVITNVVNDSDTILYIQDDTRIPEAPNLLVIGGNMASAETVKLVKKEGIKLTVERGYQGTAKNWPMNTVIARNFTDADYEAIIENIKGIYSASVPYNTEIVGDGIVTSFTITHNKNTRTPNVGLFSEDGERIYPNIKAINADQVIIEFLHPLWPDQKFLVSVN